MKHLLLVVLSCILANVASAQLDTAFVRFSLDTVKICHLNFESPCEGHYISDVQIYPDSIVITERDTTINHPTCECMYDVTTTIVGLTAGTHTALIYRAIRKYDHPDQYITQFTGHTATFHVPVTSSYPFSVSHLARACHGDVTPAWIPVVYPLHIGDAWEYTDELQSYVRRTEITRDTLMPNGRRYLDLGSSYQRQEGNRVYEWLPSDSVEWLRYDFTLAPGDTVSRLVRGEDTLDNTLAWTGPVTIDGVPRRAWGFLQVQRHIYDGFQNVWVVDSVGQSRFMTYADQMYFKGARIDGRTFGIISAVREHGEVPASYVLEQNYPNPFNPSTTIRYALPHRSHVTLTIYNMLGQKVAEPVNGEMEVGYHEVLFEASNLASGVYFYRLQAGSFVATKKLLLLR